MAKKHRKHFINLYTYKKGKSPIRSFRPLTFEYLGDSLYEITNKEQFIFQVMKGITPINKSVKNEKKSLDDACNKFFSFLPIRKGKMYAITDGKSVEIKSGDDDLTPVQKFLQTYLQLETLPGITYKQIEEEVKTDLQEINDLIKFYESKPFIQLVLSKNAQPKSHEERILFDFYNRCIKEQRMIIDYYLNGVKKRAIAKANYLLPNMRSIISWSDRFRDRPYQFAGYFAVPYFDYRRIDLLV